MYGEVNRDGDSIQPDGLARLKEITYKVNRDGDSVQPIEKSGKVL